MMLALSPVKAFRKRRRRPDEAPQESFNMTPMIDVVFQLLIFFMLTMKFKEVEGKLLSQLPKIGPQSGPATILEEIRVVICAGGDWRTHLADKGSHEAQDKPGVSCRMLVERNDIGEVFRTETDPARRGHNRAVYRALGTRTRELASTVPGHPRIVLDADSEVPYEHVIGAVNALQEERLTKIEFVANPRHERYYGSGQPGQFPRGR
jgi:biopolymer transport protein ExbD